MSPNRADDLRGLDKSIGELSAYRRRTEDDISELKDQLAKCVSTDDLNREVAHLHQLYGWVNKTANWAVLLGLAAIFGAVWRLIAK